MKNRLVIAVTYRYGRVATTLRPGNVEISPQQIDLVLFFAGAAVIQWPHALYTRCFAC